MTILAIGAERARAIGTQMRRGWRGWKPFGRFLAEFAGGAVEVTRGLLEAHWDFPVTGRTGEAGEPIHPRDRRTPSPVVHTRGGTVGPIGRRTIRPDLSYQPDAGPRLRSTPAPAGWTIAASRVIELGPEDEVPW